MPWIAYKCIVINEKVRCTDGPILLTPLLPVSQCQIDDFHRTEQCSYKGCGNTKKVEKQRTDGLHGKDRYTAHDVLIQVCYEADAKGDTENARDLWRRELEKVRRAFRLWSGFATCRRREGRKEKSQTTKHFLGRLMGGVQAKAPHRRGPPVLGMGLSLCSWCA